MQLQQLAFHERWEYNTDVDPTHPLIKAFEQIGLYLNREAEPIEMEPSSCLVTVDSAVEIFLANKPGAKQSSVKVVSSCDEQSNVATSVSAD
jgi:hypothetical protein